MNFNFSMTTVYTTKKKYTNKENISSTRHTYQTVYYLDTLFFSCIKADDN